MEISIEIKNYNDFFLPLSKRSPRGVYFYKFIGYDDDIILFLKKYQLATVHRGVYYREAIKNPTENEVKRCQSLVDSNFILNEPFILNNLKALLNIEEKPLDLLGKSMFKILNKLKDSGANDSILKNAYIKFMCWCLRFKSFLRYLGEDDNPKVLYEGDIAKYDLYMLEMLSLCGCDVVYINFLSDDSINKYGKDFGNIKYGEKKGTPLKHFSTIDLNYEEEKKSISKEINEVADKIITNTWIENNEYFEGILKTNELRGVLINPNKLYNIVLQYLGIDNIGKYNNRLLELNKVISAENKPYVLIDKRIENPLIDEIENINKNNCVNKNTTIESFSNAISNIVESEIKAYVLRAFKIIMDDYNEKNLNQLYNFAMKILCWIKRYREVIKYDGKNISTVIYFGECSDSEEYFLKFLSLMPIDVIYISPNKCAKPYLGGSLIELPQSENITEYPHKEMKVKAATVAYNAEKEIESELYNNNTGLFKNQQFTRSTPITLKTTYEEIFILWDQESKYRPSFKSNEDRVYVPNIFAKVCGVPDGQVNSYIKKIKSVITEKTIYFSKVPLLNRGIKIGQDSLRGVIENNKINENKIKSIREYKYEYLNINIQNYILEKIQELIDLKWIIFEGNNINEVILATLLDLDKVTLNLIQQFDFTKEIPKVVIVDTDESMATLVDCIYLLFLNLVGFDILIFTPTGYRNIEKFIKEESFENYVVGEMIFDIKSPKLKAITVDNDTGFFNKLFR